MNYIIVEKEPLFNIVDWELLKRILPDEWPEFMYMNSLVVIDGRIDCLDTGRNILHCYKHQNKRRYINIMRPNAYGPYEAKEITCWTYVQSNTKNLCRYNFIATEIAVEYILA